MACKLDHSDSRLTCIDCGSSICSKCLVQCPVGFRCKSCVGTAKNPATEVSFAGVAKTLMLCGFAGFGAGWILPMISIPFLCCIIAYFAGLFAGQGLAKVIDHKLGHRLGMVIVFGLLIGMSLSPFGMIPIAFFQLLGMSFTHMEQGMSIITVLTFLVNAIFSPTVFILGVLRSTVWQRWW